MNLLARLVSQGLSQREIASRLGVGENYLSQIKRGKLPSVSLLLALQWVVHESSRPLEAKEQQGARLCRVLLEPLTFARLQSQSDRSGLPLGQYLHELVSREGDGFAERLSKEVELAQASLSLRPPQG